MSLGFLEKRLVRRACVQSSKKRQGGHCALPQTNFYQGPRSYGAAAVASAHGGFAAAYSSADGGQPRVGSRISDCQHRASPPSTTDSPLRLHHYACRCAAPRRSSDFGVRGGLAASTEALAAAFPGRGCRSRSRGARFAYNRLAERLRHRPRVSSGRSGRGGYKARRPAVRRWPRKNRTHRYAASHSC
jgi:hypothetical protein